jgi:hypothetical protein
MFGPMADASAGGGEDAKDGAHFDPNAHHLSL